MKQQSSLIAPLRRFQHAIVAVDLVIFALRGNSVMVLLLKAKLPPFSGSWVLPGGLVAPDENFDQAVMRHLKDKTGLKKVYAEQLYTFGECERDPRGRVVSVAYLAMLPNIDDVLESSANYEAIEWHDIKKMPPLGYDHADMIALALHRLQSKLGYMNIAQYLLPSSFTLSELQALYETVLGRSLDKRNFRKKILSLDLVEKLDKKSSGSFRPAELYRFSHKKPRVVEIL